MRDQPLARGARLRSASAARHKRPALTRWATGFLLGVGLHATTADAQCLLVRERGGETYTPHLALHFGDPSDLPLHINCATPLDKDLATMCVPIYAYDLWEGADGFEFSVRTPKPPIGFDRGPEIIGVDMHVETSPDVAVTSLRLTAGTKVCGPVLLGCLRLATANLPDSFRILVGDHQLTGRCAAHAADKSWRQCAIDRGGGRVGRLACPDAPCGTNAPITALNAAPGERIGLVDLQWASGSGNFTLLRYRADGQYPSDPWDGELLAFLPSTATRYTYLSPVPGDVRIAAWSVTRGPYGNLFAASSVECGALASIFVQLPVGTTANSWSRMKTLYR